MSWIWLQCPESQIFNKAQQRHTTGYRIVKQCLMQRHHIYTNSPLILLPSLSKCPFWSEDASFMMQCVHTPTNPYTHAHYPQSTRKSHSSKELYQIPLIQLHVCHRRHGTTCHSFTMRAFWQLQWRGDTPAHPFLPDQSNHPPTHIVCPLSVNSSLLHRALDALQPIKILRQLLN